MAALGAKTTDMIMKIVTGGVFCPVIIEDHVLRFNPPKDCSPRRRCFNRFVFCSGCCRSCRTRSDSKEGRWRDTVMQIEMQDKAYLKLYLNEDRKTILGCIRLVHIYNDVMLGNLLEGQSGLPKLPEDVDSRLMMAIPEDLWGMGEVHWVIFKNESKMRKWLVVMKEEVEREVAQQSFLSSTATLGSAVDNTFISDFLAQLERRHSSYSSNVKKPIKCTEGSTGVNV